MSDRQLLEGRQETWNGFVKLLIWSVAAVVVILGLMGIFLV